jgi:O-antigen/teichoic acid export membrane protein
MAESGARRFSRHVAWTLAAKVAIAGSSLLSGIIVARWLGSSGVGVVAALSVVTMIAITFGGLGLPSSTTFLVARDTTKAKLALINAVVFSLLSGALMSGVIIMLAALRPQLFGDVPPRLLTVAAVALPAQMLSYISLAIYLGLEKIRSYNFIDLSLQAIILVNALFTLAILGFGLNELVIFGAAANIAAGLIIVALLARTLKATAGTWHIDADLLRETLRYGLRFLVAIAASTVILRGDLLIVNYFRGTGEAGVYAVSTQAATLLQMMPAVISTILFPRAASKQDASGALTCRVTRHATLIMFFVCLLAAPASFLLPMLYGPSFTAVPMQFLIMLPGVFLLGIETIQVQHFTALGLPRSIPFFWLATMAISIGLNIALVPRFGAIGAAAVSSVSYTIMFVLIATYFRKHTGRSFREAFVLTREEFRVLFDLGRGSIIFPAGESG